LEYEEALTRQKLGESTFTATPSSSRPPSPTPSRSASSVRKEEKYTHYNLSSHFIWIGDRTRQLDGAHVEYFRGIANPIGIKVGPTMEPAELVRILDIVNPDRIIGKVTVIGRYGAGKVEQYLPAHIDAVKATDHVVVWQCDAMHGK
jgi:3-deoxy-7-phosphoheptulonate synthase